MVWNGVIFDQEEKCGEDKMGGELVENLKLFGLSDYEAKAYIALASLGTASVTEVSQACSVPRSNLYSVLEGLAERGFADVQRGRPILFKAIPARQILDEIFENKKTEIIEAKKIVIEKIENLSSKKKMDTVPALIWGIRGHGSVLNKIEEIVDRSKDNILINVPDLNIFNDKIIEGLKKAHKRGVKIKIAAEKEHELKHCTSLRTRKKIHGVDIVSDDGEVLVAPSFPVVAAWLDNPEMALHVKDFLNLVWKDAKVLK